MTLFLSLQNGLDVFNSKRYLSGKEAHLVSDLMLRLAYECLYSSSAHFVSCVFFLIQHLLKKFLGLVHKFKLPVFLVDTASLTLLSQDAVLYRDSRLNEPHCSFFCTHRDFTTFALYGNLWKYDVRKSIQSCWKSLLSSSQDLYLHEVTKYIMTGT